MRRDAAAHPAALLALTEAADETVGLSARRSGYGKRTDRVDYDALLIRPGGCVVWALSTGQGRHASTRARALGTWFCQPA
ncbi:hypothetical protein [Streptomyces pactum]|uniref:aromatic-ring hydroxylase C-terminal domain-containing protein n=1 Tax=Streptomyces pactum TaxID=68249 RepID=UPI003908318F